MCSGTRIHRYNALLSAQVFKFRSSSTAVETMSLYRKVGQTHQTRGKDYNRKNNLIVQSLGYLPGQEDLGSGPCSHYCFVFLIQALLI